MISIIKRILQIYFYIIKTYMNKYTYTILIIAIAIISGTFYYTSPTQQWARQEKLYNEQINAIGREKDSIQDWVLSKIKQIETLSWQIQSDRILIENKSKEIDRLILCRNAHSVDCIKADKHAMVSLIPQANATIEWEKSEQDVRENIINATPVQWAYTKVNPKVTTYYTNNPQGDQCKDMHNEPTRIVLHHTATPSTITVESIVASHHRKNGTSHYAGYHYLIKADGAIVQVRPENCNALAAPVANHDGIHISYIGDDKPNKAQLDSLIWLTKDVSKRLNISIKNVTAHADIQAKNHKESMDYMFGGYQAFQKLIRLTQTITRDGKQMDALTYAYQAWGDMDFILTIQKESQFNPESKGDIDRPNKGDYSFGYCQYNSNWQHLWLEEYKNLKTYQEQLNHCHEKYVYASTLPGGVGSRFHGYNDRLTNSSRFVIQ